MDLEKVSWDVSASVGLMEKGQSEIFQRNGHFPRRLDSQDHMRSRDQAGIHLTKI